ncbi:MAG: enoyl-CoA hydratase-related protein [Pseudomonadota bacterium]
MSEAATQLKPDNTEQEVLYAVSDHVATITLNAPSRMNTISTPMLNLLTKMLIDANQDPDVRVVILTGSGRAFCAGLDVASTTDKKADGPGRLTSGQMPVNLDLRNTPPTVMHNMDKPTICALNGGAAGYGMDIALGCDIRIMSDASKLAAAFTKRGVVPESGGTWILPRLIGWSKASEVIFSGRTLGPQECVDMGLASRVVPAADLMTETNTLAANIAANAPLAVQSSKRMMRMGLNENFNDHVHHVFLQLLPLMRTDDVREGMQAFMEKREPKFTGK